MKVWFPLFFVWVSLVFAEEPTEVISLWPDGRMPGPAPMVDGEERDTTKEDGKLIAGKPLIRLGHVSNPEIHVYLPPQEKRNGSAVVVCPGGGFSILAWDLEGTEVAEWLNEIGISAVVLKYRVPTREHGDEVIPTKRDESILAPFKAIGPMMDAQRALSLTRSKSDEWGINPDKVGILGFSAGGQTAALAAVATGKRSYDPLDPVDESSCRADFALLVYPGGLADPVSGELAESLKKSISKDVPPMFLVHAANDRVTALSSSALFQALNLAKVPAELHVFARGGHGYGLRETKTPVTKWTRLAEDWLVQFDYSGGDIDHFISFGKEMALRKKGDKALLQFSAKFPDAGITDAEVAQKSYVKSLLENERFGGIKGAVVGEGGQDLFGINGPLSAVLFEDGLKYYKGDRVKVEVREGAEPGLETELGIILKDGIRKQVKSVEELKSKVRSIVPVVELPAGKHNWSKKLSATDLVAANVDSDVYIIGKEWEDISIDLDAIEIKLISSDGDVLNETIGGMANRGQWWNFLHQVNWAIKQGYEFRPGDFVITGALGKIRRDGIGEYRAEFGELGNIEFELVPEP